MVLCSGLLFKIISIDLSSTEVDDERQTSNLAYLTRGPKKYLGRRLETFPIQFVDSIVKSFSQLAR